ncbi:MAG: energy transducer TonB [Xanthomonadaceae bacterium]|nr:energy transducer TonB [Xanthomonadaceae bacterium]MDE1965028.1 energy transducer TonB [Xanthomonadaceae bacterium]
MSSASLAVAPRHRPDQLRVAALSAAIAFNLVVLVAAMRPLAPPFTAPVPEPKTLAIRWREPPPPIPPQPPVLDVKPLPAPVPPAPVTRVKPTPVAPPVVTPIEDGNVQAPPATTPTLAPTAPDATAAPAPIEASLAYRRAPLSYPAQAVRQRMHGIVLLRVLVDEQGKPIDVQVERSSGYVLLDRSARAQVLDGWSFQPAMVDGKAVRAWARVPVNFDLRSE